MSLVATSETISRKTRHRWFHGFTYNATPGSRTQITDTIKNGYVFCHDAEAGFDSASLPTGMVIQGGSGDARLVKNVTKPATGVLTQFAGVVVGLPPEGLPASAYANGCWLELCYDAEAVKTYMLGDMSSAGVETLLGPVDAQWYMGIVALGTNGANLPRIFGNPLVKSNVAAAAFHPARIAPGFMNSSF